MTGSTAIFWPMIAQTALIFVIYWIMSKRRVGAVKSGEVKAEVYRVPDREPAVSAAAARSVSNQFELPVLFYVVCLSLFITNGSNFIVLLVAWLFVVSRVVHAFIHLTTNRLSRRRPAFIAGFILVGALWLWFAVHLLAL